MNKEKLIIGIIIAVSILLVAGIVFLVVDYLNEKELQREKDALKASYGCHVVDDAVYAHFAGDCYVFNDKTGEPEALTSVALDGYQSGESFVGTLELLDYQHSESGFLEGTPLVTKMGDFYTILDRKTCRHAETNEDGSNKMVTHFTDYEFTYYVYPENPEFLAVIIYEHVKDKYHVGIFANSEERAKEYYQWFRENEPKN